MSYPWPQFDPTNVLGWGEFMRAFLLRDCVGMLHADACRKIKKDLPGSVKVYVDQTAEYKADTNCFVLVQHVVQYISTYPTATFSREFLGMYQHNTPRMTASEFAEAVFRVSAHEVFPAHP
jgi:hypothetical protein